MITSSHSISVLSCVWMVLNLDAVDSGVVSFPTLPQGALSLSQCLLYLVLCPWTHTVTTVLLLWAFACFLSHSSSCQVCTSKNLHITRALQFFGVGKVLQEIC